MIHNQASRLATGLVNNKIIESESHDIYTYGFELIISAMVNILLMALISIAFFCYYDWVLFLAAFIPLRTTAGGYHASSHLKCIIIGTLFFTILLVITQLQVNWIVAIPAIVIISLILILVFSPVEAKNKNGLGEFTIENVTAGNYVLVIKRPGYLRRCMNVTISINSPGTVELAPPNTDPTDDEIFKLWYGDADDSYKVDNDDLALVLEQMGLGITASSTLYKPGCDFDASGAADTDDIDLIFENWAKYISQYAGGENVDYFS